MNAPTAPPSVGVPPRRRRNGFIDEEDMMITTAKDRQWLQEARRNAVFHVKPVNRRTTFFQDGGDANDQVRHRNDGRKCTGG